MVQINSQKGFALVAAIMALLVLTAVGLLAFALSTQDLRISSRWVGEKKAFLGGGGGNPSVHFEF